MLFIRLWLYTNESMLFPFTNEIRTLIQTVNIMYSMKGIVLPTFYIQHEQTALMKESD